MNTNLYLVTLVHGSVDNMSFVGLARSLTGAVNTLKRVYPNIGDFDIVSHSPRGDILCKMKDSKVFAHFSMDQRPTLTGNSAWVVMKRNAGKNTERVWALFNSDTELRAFVDRTVDNAKWLYHYEDEIYEVNGYKKLSMIVGDEDPALNKIHYSIHQVVIEE